MFSRRSIVCIALLALVWLWQPLARAQVAGPLYTLELDGVLTAVSVGYLQRALQQAEASQASALVISVRTEGAVLRALRPLAVELAAARVPVIVYVAPDTAAGAAGAFLLSAAHIAAMAPGSSFGSAAPLAQVDQQLSEQSRDMVLDSVAKQLRDWNQRRGRSSAWVDLAIGSGAILTSEQASATTPPSVDLVARDLPELLTLLEGRLVTLEDGRQVPLATLGRTPQPIAPTLWESLRLLLANPSVAFLLLALAAVAFYAELANPGTTVFAGVGVLLLLAAFAGLASLPIRWPSVLALLLAFVVMGADLYLPSHGALTVLGLGLLLLGSLTLIDPAQAPGVFVDVWLIGLVTLAVATLAALWLWLALRTRRQPIATGSEVLLGKHAEVRQRLDPEGMIFVEGALWRAVSENGDAEQGEWVEITAVHNLRLLVKRTQV